MSTSPVSTSPVSTSPVSTSPAATEAKILEPNERVLEYTRRFRRFLDEDVAALERELAAAKVGTPWQPHHDACGRMHPTVQQARREVQQRAGALGLYAPHMGTRFGGSGFGRVEMHHVEEYVYRHSGLGLGLAALAWTEGPYPSSEYINPALHERYLTPLIKGQMTLAFANTEISGGSDVLAMTTHAKRDGNDWVINGRKSWITNAHFADVVQLVCVTEPGAGIKSLSMFLVDTKTPGFQHGVDMPNTMDDGFTGELIFDNVRVPAENIVGEIGDGFALAMMSINWRRLCRGGMCAGWGKWMIERAVQYAQQRQSGGKPIAEHQAVQNMLTRMDMDVYQARSTSLIAQAELDRIGPFKLKLHSEVPRLVSLLKVINDEAFFRVADNAVQIRGASGLMRGAPEEKLFRIARNLRVPAGTTEIQMNAIARGMLRRT